MRLKWLGLVFPLGVLGLMAAERAATFLLGSHPSSAMLWATSLELRSIFARSAGWLELAGGDFISVQLAMIAALALALLFMMRLRGWATFSFLINHTALIMVGLAALLASGNRIASSGAPFVDSGELLLSGSLGLSAFHYALLAFGAAGCASCHYLFLSQKAASQRAVALALSELALNLEGRRAIR
jgi:hypothetical protein